MPKLGIDQTVNVYVRALVQLAAVMMFSTVALL